jgi:hypothetical protein
MIQWLSRLLIVPESPEDAKFLGFKTCFYIFAAFNLLAVLLSVFIKYEYDEPPKQKVAGM